MLSRNINRKSFSPLLKQFSRLVSKDVAVIGVPFGGGQRKDGVEDFPTTVRKSGILQKIGRRRLTDYGDIEIPSYSNELPEKIVHNGRKIRNTIQCGQVSERLADRVEEAAREGNICLTIGGDHSIVTGSLQGHLRAREDLCLIWIDAHLDLNTYQTSPSGNVHGMTLSFILEGVDESVNTLPGFEWVTPCLNPRDLVYIGLRDPDPEEFDLAEKLGILMFTHLDVERYGINEVLTKALKRVNPNLSRPVHVSFDVDVLDPVFCPGTGTPVPGGLTVREGMYIGEVMNRLGILAGLDIVEVNTSLCRSIEKKDLTINSSLSILEAFLK